MRRSIFLTISLLTIILNTTVSSQNLVDSSFGTNGIAIYNDATTNRIYQIAGLANGQFLRAGMDIVGSRYAHFVIQKYDQHGVLDSSFGVNGRVTTVINVNEEIKDMILQPDGKILVAGRTWQPALPTAPNYERYDIAIVRYHSNGQADSSFGTNGIRQIDNMEYDIPGNMALQPDGKILLAKEMFDNPGTHYLDVLRLYTNGLNDPGYSLSRCTSTYNNPYGQAISLQPDGKVIAAVNILKKIVRYQQSGGVDSSYALNGFISGQGSDKIRTLPDTSLLVQVLMKIRKYKPNGTLDSSFGINGTTADLFGSNSYGYDCALQGDGKIVVIGKANGQLTLVRYLSNGLIDSSFNGTGVYSISSVPYSGQIYTYSNKILVSARINNDRANMLMLLNQYHSLPLNLYAFNTFLKNNIVFLNWSTTNEQNTSHFIIERSINARSFEAIGEVKAQSEKQTQSTPEKINYTSTDAGLIRFSSINTFYYRLKMVDKDGKFTYSNIVTLNRNKKADAITICPNPAQNFVNILLPGANNESRSYIVELIDVTGKSVIKKAYTSTSNMLTIPTHRIQAGTYVVKLTFNGTTYQEKVIITK